MLICTIGMRGTGLDPDEADERRVRTMCPPTEEERGLAVNYAA